MLNGAKNAVGKTATVIRKAGSIAPAGAKTIAAGKIATLTGIIEVIEAEIIAATEAEITPISIIEAIETEVTDMQTEVIRAIIGMRVKIIGATIGTQIIKTIETEVTVPVEYRRAKPDGFSVKERAFIRLVIVTTTMTVV